MAKLSVTKKRLGRLATPLVSDEGTQLGSYHITYRESSFDAHEVEAALLDLPWVDQACVVLSWEKRPKRWVLLAAMTSKTRRGNVRLEVKNYLKSRVKAYMIPQRIRIISKLPTINGHVDRIELASGRVRSQKPEIPVVRAPKNSFIFEGMVTFGGGYFLKVGVHPVGEPVVQVSMRNKFRGMGFKQGDYLLIEGKFWGKGGNLIPTKITRVKPRASIMLTNTEDLLEALG